MGEDAEDEFPSLRGGGASRQGRAEATLMLQRVLAEPAWMARMTPADVRGLTPLVWGHVSPYGTFDLDMERRLDLGPREAA